MSNISFFGGGFSWIIWLIIIFLFIWIFCGFFRPPYYGGYGPYYGGGYY